MLKFITDNTANLTPQQIKNFIEIAENTAKLLIINLIQEHTKDYVQSS
ncbi:MAG: hypothetical protein LBU14_02345 [Candidatus Peribacteria bacterium]|nr:hypothetical protein [Candidatus Peribacteria bacterium]